MNTLAAIAKPGKTMTALPEPTYRVAEDSLRHGMHPCYLNDQNIAKYGREGVYCDGFTADQMRAYALAAIAADRAANEAAPPVPVEALGLSRAIERMKAQVQWLRNGKLFDSCPMMAVDDMEVMLSALASSEASRAAEPADERAAFEAVISFQSDPKEIGFDYWRAGRDFATGRAAEPVAWSFVCKKAPSGGQMSYASADAGDSMHWPMDQWRSVERTPLAPCGPAVELKKAAAGSTIAHGNQPKPAVEVSDMEKLEMAAPVEVTIRRNADGVTRTYNDDFGVVAEDDGEPSVYMWSYGNYSCDCNRGLFFAQCCDEDEDESDVRCSHGLYSVRLKYKGEVFYDELEPAAAVTGEPG